MSRHSAIHYCQPEEVPADHVLLRLSGQVNKKQLLQALAEAYQFPEHYGNNWDAAWDCLHDLENIKPLVLDLRMVQEVEKSAFKELMNLVVDAYDSWSQPDLWIIQRQERQQNNHYNNRRFRRTGNNHNNNNNNRQNSSSSAQANAHSSHPESSAAPAAQGETAMEKNTHTLPAQLPPPTEE